MQASKSSISCKVTSLFIQLAIFSFFAEFEFLDYKQHLCLVVVSGVVFGVAED